MDLDAAVRKIFREELSRATAPKKGQITAVDESGLVYTVDGREMLSTYPDLKVGQTVAYVGGNQPMILGPLDGSVSGNYTPPTVVDPTPGFTAGVRIDPSRLVLSIDPTDPTSYDPRRARGQWIIAGNRFNVGEYADNIGPTVPGDDDGYNLVFDANSEVHSFEMQDGSTMRLGTITVRGRTMLCVAGQFTGEGYSAANNNIPQAGLNSALVRGPGANDPAFFDGIPRCQLGLGETLIGVGPNAPLVRYATEFRVEPWMDANDWTTAPFELHAPGAGYSSPLLSQIIGGELIIWARNASQPLDYDTSSNSNTTPQELVRMTLPAAGEMVSLVYEFRVDPTGVRPVFNLYAVDDSGAPILLKSYNEAYGFMFTDDELNASFYPIVSQLYCFHQYSPGPTNNWDTSGGWGNVRRLCSSFIAMAVGEDVSIEELGLHALSFQTAVVTPTPPPDVETGNTFTLVHEQGDHASWLQGSVLTWAGNFSGDDWEKYGSAIGSGQYDGNAGWGGRRFAAVDTAVYETLDVLQITARQGDSGDGADDGILLTSGAKLRGPTNDYSITYGRVRCRARVDVDPDEVTSGLCLMWPRTNLHSWEINIFENFANRDDRIPVESHLHWDDNNQQRETNHPGVDASQWHDYEMVWTPESVTVSIDGATPKTLSQDPSEVPNEPMEVVFQLDAWNPPEFGWSADPNPQDQTNPRQPVLSAPVSMQIEYFSIEQLDT